MLRVKNAGRFIKDEKMGEIGYMAYSISSAITDILELDSKESHLQLSLNELYRVLGNNFRKEGLEVIANCDCVYLNKIAIFECGDSETAIKTARRTAKILARNCRIGCNGNSIIFSDRSGTYFYITDKDGNKIKTSA